MAGCSVQRSPITGQKRAYGYSWEEEVKLGGEADRQIQRQYGTYGGAELTQYVNELGQRVLEVSHMRREDTPEKYRETEFHFRILDAPSVNAFALPGGFIYVTRGLMAHLENEAQLAVVLGHEIGHVAARHASQRAFEQQMGQIALLGGAIAGQELLGVPGGSILQAGSQAARFLFLKYSREDERESDGLGVEYAARLGYDAAEGADFFTSLERISRQSGQSLPNFLSTHPDPASRAESIPRLAEEWEEKGYEQHLVNRPEYLKNLEGFVYGENPRHGFRRDGFFYHPDLAFLFDLPEGWNLINRNDLVALISPEEDAAVIMQIDQEHETAESSVAAFLSQEGVTGRSGGAARQHGLAAYTALADAEGDEGTKYTFHIRAVEYGELVYRFFSYTMAERFSAYRPLFEETSASFRELADEQILAIQPVRLRISGAAKTAPLHDLLPAELPGGATGEDIAILNQIGLDDTVTRGRLLKMPRGNE